MEKKKDFSDEENLPYETRGEKSLLSLTLSLSPFLLITKVMVDFNRDQSYTNLTFLIFKNDTAFWYNWDKKGLIKLQPFGQGLYIL